MVPLGFNGRVEAWIETIERRKIFIKSRLTDAGGTIYAEGDALFIELSADNVARLDRARGAR
jgi:hypothetical protein